MTDDTKLSGLEEVIERLAKRNQELADVMQNMRATFFEQLRQDKADTMAMIQQLKQPQTDAMPSQSLEAKMKAVGNRHYWGGEMLDILKNYNQLLQLSEQQAEAVPPAAIFDLLLQYGKPL